MEMLFILGKRAEQFQVISILLEQFSKSDILRNNRLQIELIALLVFQPHLSLTLGHSETELHDFF